LPDYERITSGLIGEFYPFKWIQLESSDLEALIRTVQNQGQLTELAIALEGTNVFGFLKGEVGVHRRSDKRPSGERVQRMAEVTLLAPGELTARAGLEHDLLLRAAEQERRMQTKKQRAAQTKAPEPEVIRVYQFEGERSVRDLRTRMKVNDPQTVLDGNLDDFILAYLREEEAAEAWNDAS
jgi:protein subunit release factor B